MNERTGAMGSPVAAFASMMVFGMGSFWCASEAAEAILALKWKRLLGGWVIGLALLIGAIVQIQALYYGSSALVSTNDVLEFTEQHPALFSWLLLLRLAATLAAWLAKKWLIAPRSHPLDPIQEARVSAIGTLGELRVKWVLEELGWPFLRNVVIALDGWSAEIDAIVRTPSGIVLLEVKA